VESAVGCNDLCRTGKRKEVTSKFSKVSLRGRFDVMASLKNLKTSIFEQQSLF
jgi:hypothetical protein